MTGLSMLLAALTALIRRRNGQLSFYTFETVRPDLGTVDDDRVTNARVLG